MWLNAQCIFTYCLLYHHPDCHPFSLCYQHFNCFSCYSCNNKTFYFNSVECLQPPQKSHNECHEAISCCNRGVPFELESTLIDRLSNGKLFAINFSLFVRLIFFNLFFTSLSLLFLLFESLFYGHFSTIAFLFYFPSLFTNFL
jgi:hypothetical protein